MKRSSSISLIAAGAVLALAACGSSGGSASAGGTAAGSPSAHAAKPVSRTSAGVHVAHTSLGSVLVDGKGMTLYMLTSDSANHSGCNAACLHYWPLVPASQGKHAKGVMATVGSTKATNGTSMLTVGGWPLYTYVQDSKPGDVTGQGVKTFGGVWYVLSPSGHPVKGSSAGSSSSSMGSRGGSGY